MTEDLIAMARKAGAWPELSTTPKKDVEFLQRFAALIEARAVARTREECAKVCDKYARKTIDAQSGRPDDLSNIMLRQVAHLGFEQAAAAIRDGEKP